MSKENYQIKPNTNMGVSFFEKEISYNGLGGKNHPLLSALANILVSALLTFGAIFTLSSMFVLKINYIVVSALLALFVFLFSAVFYMPKKHQKIAIFSTIGIILVLSGIFYSTLASGFYNIFLFGKDAIYNAMYWTKNYTIDFASLKAVDTTFAICIVGVLLALAVTFFNKERPRFFVLMLITFPFFEIGVAFGCVPNYLAFGALLSGWTATFAVFASSIVRKKKREKKAKTKSQKAAGIGAVIAVITLLAFIGSNALLTLGGYTRDNGTKELRLAIKEGFENIYDLITGEDHDASLKDGKLYKLGDREVKNRKYMTVTLTGKGLTEQLYIKGFVGSKYTGNAFTEFDNYNQYNEMFNAFERYELYPQQMLGVALEDILQQGIDKDIIASKETIKISNLRRKKDYVYTAGDANFPEVFEYNYDLTAKPSNKTKYSYTSFLDPTHYIKITSSELYFTDEYQYLRGLYNDYVEKEYLQLPENNAYLKGLVEKITADAYDDYSIADKIRYYLKDNTKYTDRVGDLPSGRDAVNYFLNENKKGYSAHYAATATLMLRAAGVPARYVEGFVIKKDVYENIKPNDLGEYVINVTDNEAHAWVEIYSKNYGWFEVEVTPGFYSGHLGETAQGGSSDEYYYDENSDITVQIPPPEDPENTVEPEEKKPSFLDIIKKYLPIIFKWVSIVLIAVVLLILIVLTVLSIRLLIIRSIRKNNMNKDAKKAVLTIYKYFNKLLLFEGIKNTEMLPYLRYAKISAKKSRALEKEQSLFLMNIFLKAAFSPYGVNKDDVITAELLVNEYKSALLKKLSFKEKLMFIFIKGLV